MPAQEQTKGSKDFVVLASSGGSYVESLENIGSGEHNQHIDQMLAKFYNMEGVSNPQALE
jgi:hypothetical protein